MAVAVGRAARTLWGVTGDLEPHETELRGTLLRQGCRIVGDTVSSRIEWLRSERLERIGDTLYRDPRDGRVWELAFEPSGSPVLRVTKTALNSPSG